MSYYVVYSELVAILLSLYRSPSQTNKYIIPQWIEAVEKLNKSTPVQSFKNRRDLIDKIQSQYKGKYPTDSLETAVNILFDLETENDDVALTDNKLNEHHTDITTKDSQNLTCIDIKQCQHLEQLKNAFLDESQHTNKTSENLDAFLHLLEQHSNDDVQFQYIYDTMGGKCDISHCKLFSRHYRDRNLCNNDHCYNINQQILDKIHSFFIHSYDIVHRLTCEELLLLHNISNTQESKCDQNTFIDTKTVTLSKIISNKPKLLPKEAMKRRFDRYQPLNDENKETVDKKYEFGVLFDYDNDEKKEAVPIPVFGKYSSVKEELTGNALCALNMSQFNHEMQKASIHYNSAYRRNNRDWNDIMIDHVLALMIYCNYNDLQNIFSKTYYINEYIQKHNEFYHLGKYISVAVNTFGSSMSNGNVNWVRNGPSRLYHGTGETLLFERLYGLTSDGISIYAPLSTSSSIEVAMNFTNHNNGMMIEFGPTGNNSKYFKLAWLSDFPNEKEHLFIQNQGTLSIANITDARTGVEFDCILKAIRVLQEITSYVNRANFTNGLDFGNILDITDNEAQFIAGILSHQLSIKLPDQWEPFKSLHEYGVQLFNLYCVNKTALGINFMNKKDWLFFHGLLFHTEYEYEWIKLDLLKILFPSILEMRIENLKFCHEMFKDILKYLTDGKCQRIEMQIRNIDGKKATSLISKYENALKRIDFVITCQINDGLRLPLWFCIRRHDFSKNSVQ
eukprot:464810_1